MASGDRIRLIVHGDDFGFSAAVNRGIWRAHRDGLLTSASLLANGAALDEACALAAGSALELGVHLNLTTGRPLLPAARVPTMVTAEGFFPGKWRMVRRALAGRLAPAELAAEIAAQLERIAGLGVRITHLDSHHHLHLLPPVAAAAAAAMRARGIGWVRRVRGPGEGGWNPAGAAGRLQQAVLAACSRRCEAAWRPFASAESFSGFAWYLSRDRRATLRRLVRALRPGLNEWMCHPADFIPAARAGSRDAHRQAECDWLCAPEVRRLLTVAGIEPTTFEP